MANFPDETLTLILSLQRQLFQLLDRATGTEFNLAESYDEIEATLGELEELQNVTERLRTAYNRLNTLLLRVAESQPVASSATLSLLEQSVEQAQVTIDVSEPSIQEIRRNWNL